MTDAVVFCKSRNFRRKEQALKLQLRKEGFLKECSPGAQTNHLAKIISIYFFTPLELIKLLSDCEKCSGQRLTCQSAPTKTIASGTQNLTLHRLMSSQVHAGIVIHKNKKSIKTAIILSCFFFYKHFREGCLLIALTELFK